MTQKIGYALILCLSAVTIYAYTYDHQVFQAQKMLKDLGYSIEKVDGKKGPNTTRIIRQFQKANGLHASGEINGSTIQVLKQLSSRQNNSNRRGIFVCPTVQNRTAFHISGQQIYDQMTAVIIGIDRYQNLGRDDQLNYAVHDARGVAALLKDKYSFKTITLYNENATRARIMKILQGDLTETGDNDAVLIYFAGHGITRKTAQGMLGYLLPSDGSVKRNEMHKNISMQQIKSDICPLIQAKHVLIIADACFGGLLLSTRATHSKPSYDFSYLKEITSERVRQIITAGGMDERVLDEGRGGHSVFTGRLIEKLEQMDRYITARQLGEDLKQKVYSDAMDRGHTQRPHVGEIYGVGDFVFIPDIAKKQQAMNEKVSRLQSEIDKLEELKISARQLKSKAQLREIEREQLLKQARLKQAQLNQRAAEREARLRKEALAEKQRQLAEAKKRKQQQSYQLAILKQKAAQLRKEVGNPATALGIDDAIIEINEINITLNKLESEFSTGYKKQIKPVRRFYKTKMRKIYEERNKAKSIYETDSDYKKRVAEFDRQLSEIEKEMELKVSDIRQKIDSELYQQKKPLLDQRAEISKLVFPISIGNVSFKLLNYNAEKQAFCVSFNISERKKTMHLIATVPIPKRQAAQYGKHYDLLIPNVNLRLSKEAKLVPYNFSFSAPESYVYECKIVKGTPIRIVDHFIIFLNQTILDTKTLLMWQQLASNKSILGRPFIDIYIDKLNQNQFAGYSDWLLPSTKELKTLLENQKMDDNAYINPIFVNKGNNKVFWTSDDDGSFDYIVNFNSRQVYSSGAWNYVRAVRYEQK